VSEESKYYPKPAADYGWILLAIPAAACMLIWFWVSTLTLFQSPGEKLTLIIVGTVIGTAIVAAMEASKLGMSEDRDKGTYGPAAWFFVILLFWVVGYPWYMFKRKHYGLSNLIIGALALALIFAFSAFAMHSAIGDQVGKLQHALDQLQ